MSLYPWNNSPAWATCGATDKNGFARWYAVTPYRFYNWWTPTSDDTRDMFIGKGFYTVDWQKSLEARPGTTLAKCTHEPVTRVVRRKVKA